MDHKHAFAHKEKKKCPQIIFGDYKLQTFYKIILCPYKNVMKHVISSCKPDLRQLSTRKLLD